MLGQTIKDFKLTAKLGAGGMGEVWAAEQQIVKTKVAIKLLHSVDPNQVQRFFNEAIAASKIKHAGIVRIYDVGFHGERAYLIMELFEGETLASRITRSGRLSTGQVAEIGRQIASVLAATHAAGITHRDLKPDNVFLIPDAELACGERVKILDFGIAKLATAGGMTGTGSSMGTPGYMAPEQWSDAATADARADIYSLGCLMFEMCTGATPFKATTIGEACTKHLTEIPARTASRVAVPAELDELIARMLEKSPASRPAIDEIQAVLTGIAASEPHALSPTLADDGTPRPPSVVRVAAPVTTLGAAAGAQIVSPPARRGRWPLALLALGLAGAGVGVALYATRTTTDDAPAVAATPPEAPKPPPLHEPKLGLDTVAAFAEPAASTASNLHSESLWLAARDDLADGCKQPGAPARWCAGRDFADGEAAMERGDARAAFEAFGRATKLDATWAVPLIGMADALSQLNDLAGALEASRRAQRLDPSSWQAVAVGGRAYVLAQKLEDGIQEFRRALALAPKNGVLLEELALVYHVAGMDAEAEKTGDAALAIDDSLAGVHLMRAELLLEKNDGEHALLEANRALAVSPKNAAAHLALGDAFALLHRPTDAFAEYQRMAELGLQPHSGAPERRVAIVRAALAKHVLPPPRGKPKTSAVGQPRVRSGSGPDSKAPCKCIEGDPLCSCL